MSDWICVRCRNHNVERAAFCIYCGSKKPAEWTCGRCHEVNVPHASYCMSCGRNRYDDESLVKAFGDAPAGAVDELLPQAIALVIEEGVASVHMLQRRLRVGHARATRMIDEMESRGVIGPDKGGRVRKVLFSREQLKEPQE